MFNVVVDPLPIPLGVTFASKFVWESNLNGILEAKHRSQHGFLPAICCGELRVWNGEKEMWLFVWYLDSHTREMLDCSKPYLPRAFETSLVSTLAGLLNPEDLILITDKNRKNVTYLFNLCKDGRKNHFSEHDYTLFDSFPVCPLI